MSKSAEEMRELALSRAEELGAEWGKDAAGWFISDTWSKFKCLLMLRGIADDDPDVTDKFPEWDDRAPEHGLYDLGRILHREGFEVGFDMDYVRKTNNIAPMRDSALMIEALYRARAEFANAVAAEIVRHCNSTLED